MMPTTLTYAGRLERLFAYLIDVLILFVLTLFAVLLLGQGGPGLIGAFLCNAAYYTAFTSGSWQATPGKRLLNIYVIRTDGRPLSQRNALDRFLSFIIPSLPIYSSLLTQQQAASVVLWLSIMWFMPILTTPQRTGLHDRICDTRVVVGKPR